MSEATLDRTLALAVGLFVLLLFVMEFLTYRHLRKAGEAGTTGPVRAVLFAAMRPAILAGLAAALLTLLGWALPDWNAVRGHLLPGVQLFVAYAVLALGTATFAMRVGLTVLQRSSPERSRSALLLARGGITALALLYAASVLYLQPGGIMETSLSALLIGFALILMGLNRRDMSAELTGDGVAKLPK